MSDGRTTDGVVGAERPERRSSAFAADGPGGGWSGPAVWVAAAAVVVTASFVVFSNPSADTDLWGHLMFGLAKLDARGVIPLDPYSFTAEGQPWFNHEWLAEVIGAAVYRIGGQRLLLAGKMSVGMLLALWLVLETRRRGASPPLATAIGVTVVYALWPGTMFRPQLFSYLMFALLLGLLHRVAEGRRRLAALFPVVVALWVNLHGGFVVGLGALAVFAGWQLLRWLLGRERLPDVGPVLAGCAGAALAVLVNPYGLGLPRFLAATLTRGRPIGEWAPLPLATGDLVEIKVVGVVAVVLAVAAVLGRFDGLRGWEVVLLFATVVATLRHQRHAPFLLLTAAPFAAWALSEIGRRLARRGELVRLRALPAVTVTAALVTVAVVQAGVAATAVLSTGGTITVDPTRFPVTAVRFLAAQRAVGRLVLPFEWGEYALWHLSPGLKVSLDGRFETVYPEEVRDAHFQAAVDPAMWGILAEAWRADVLLAPAVPEVIAIAERRPGEWRLVWVDPVAAVLVRRAGTAAAVRSPADGGRSPSDERPLTAFP